MCCLTVLEARGRRSKSWQSWLPEGHERKLSQAFPSPFCGLWAISGISGLGDLPLLFSLYTCLCANVSFFIRSPVSSVISTNTSATTCFQIRSYSQVLVRTWTYECWGTQFNPQHKIQGKNLGAPYKGHTHSMTTSFSILEILEYILEYTLTGMYSFKTFWYAFTNTIKFLGVFYRVWNNLIHICFHSGSCGEPFLSDECFIY